MKNNNQQAQSILLTGATGLIGSHLIPELDDYHQIFYLGRAEHPHRKNALIYTDLATNWDINGLPSHIDNIIYLAQSDFFRDFPDKANDIFAVNINSVFKMLEYARKIGVKRFIYASSGGVYGPSNKAIHEDSSLEVRDNLGFYLSTKLCAEALLENYSAYMQIIILRFFFVYGPRQKKDMLIPRLIQRVRQNESIIIQGNDGLSLNPTYVDDAVQSIKSALLLNGNHKINIGGPEITSLRGIGTEIGLQLGQMPRFEQSDGEPAHLVADIGRMCELLWKPQISFSEGLQALLTQGRKKPYNG